VNIHRSCAAECFFEENVSLSVLEVHLKSADWLCIWNMEHHVVKRRKKKQRHQLQRIFIDEITRIIVESYLWRVGEPDGEKQTAGSQNVLKSWPKQKSVHNMFVSNKNATSIPKYLSTLIFYINFIIRLIKKLKL
jgi:hypothetical protein